MSELSRKREKGRGSGRIGLMILASLSPIFSGVTKLN